MSALGLHWADWLVLGLYLVGITGIGIWSYRRVHDAADFFMGGRRFGKIFMMFFAFGAGTSSEQAVAVSAGSFRFGLAGIWYQFLWLWATPFYWIVAPVMRRMRALTTSDFFESRYDSSTALLYSVLGIGMSIIFMAAALFFGARMVTGLTGGGFPLELAIGAMTVMFVLYGMAGGLNAAVVTDFVQGILTITFSFLLLPFALSYAARVSGAENGFAALHQGVPGFSGKDMLNLTISPELSQRLGMEPITLFYVFMLSLNGLIGIVVQPHIMGICGAGKTEFEGRFGFTAGNFIKRLCTIAWTFTGLACVVIYLTPGTGLLTENELQGLHADPQAMRHFADSVFGRAAHDLLPQIAPGLVGLLFACLLAAIMSSCDAQMVVASGLFTENIYRRYVRPNASQRHYVWVGRISGLVIVLMSIMVMTQFRDVIQVLNVYVNAIPAFMGLAFWIGITWRGFTPAAVWASTVVAALLWYLTTRHAPLAWIAALGEGPLLTQNLDYFPSLFREWLWNTFPFTKFEVVQNGRVLIDAKTSIPWQYVIYLGGGTLAGILTSLVSARTPRAQLDHFFRLIRTPVRPGEKVDVPCTLPEDPLPPETGKLLPWKDFEIPTPSRIGLWGFVIAWVICVALILLTWGMARLGG